MSVLIDNGIVVLKIVALGTQIGSNSTMTTADASSITRATQKQSELTQYIFNLRFVLIPVPFL